MASEAERRAAVVTEAKSWIHTPWRHMGAVKGQAVDCAMLLARTFVNAGVVVEFDPRPYARLWFLHHDEERFIGWILKLGAVEIPVAAAQPGDALVYRIGRCYSHGGLLVAPKMIVHAYHRERQCTMTETFDGYLARHPCKAFDFFARSRA